MSPHGTAAYDGLSDLPPLVERAVSVARRAGFENSCRPEHGRLLFALASGAELIGETGTGCGVGLAWLASGARPGTRLVSVELDPARATLAAELFSALPHVTVICADWREMIHREGPFDLLVLDGGAHGKKGGAHLKHSADPHARVVHAGEPHADLRREREIPGRGQTHEPPGVRPRPAPGVRPRPVLPGLPGIAGVDEQVGPGRRGQDQRAVQHPAAGRRAPGGLQPERQTGQFQCGHAR
ncbi:MAG TPA: class I SAM-dependent methyltransferase [Streptosporangiaceae bacterium]